MERTTFCKTVTLLIVLIGCAIWNGPGGIRVAGAYDLPGLNLGLTSFLDGGPPAGPGFYFTQYFNYYHASKLTNSSGNEALPPFAGETLNVYLFLSQFIYQSNHDVLLGGKWGLDFIIPVVVTDLSYNTYLPGFPQDNGAGLGDILVGPFLQWDPIPLGCNGPLFMHRVELQMMFPTGKYDNDKAVNPGSNFFSFDPYWAATLFITPKWEFSTRIHYLWNTKNNDPNRFDDNGIRGDSSLAGQAVHLNFASSYEILEKRLHAGVNGYYLKQTTDTHVNGQSVPDSREQVLGIGPGLVFHWSQDTHFFFNVYFETAAENRPEGQRYNFRVVHHF
jgi:hypothetical protein